MFKTSIMKSRAPVCRVPRKALQLSERKLRGRELGIGVWGLGIGVWGLGFRDWGLGFRV